MFIFLGTHLIFEYIIFADKVLKIQLSMLDISI